jgi:hypothetical protein
MATSLLSLSFVVCLLFGANHARKVDKRMWRLICVTLRCGHLTSRTSLKTPQAQIRYTADYTCRCGRSRNNEKKRIICFRWSQETVEAVENKVWECTHRVRSVQLDIKQSNLQKIVQSLSLSYGQRSVDQFVSVSGSLFGPMTRFYPYPFFSVNCFVLPIGRPLWREDGSVTYSAITEDQ